MLNACSATVRNRTYVIWNSGGGRTYFRRFLIEKNEALCSWPKFDVSRNRSCRCASSVRKFAPLINYSSTNNLQHCRASSSQSWRTHSSCFRLSRWLYIVHISSPCPAAPRPSLDVYRRTRQRGRWSKLGARMCTKWCVFDAATFIVI